ncbi:MAG: hypothetical protein ACLRZH_09800 [Ruthenibacterium lactatiformans]
MTKMGKAAVLEMYFNALPDVVKNAAEPLTKVDKITMYGDGNSAKLTRDIMQTVTQVTDGLKETPAWTCRACFPAFWAASSRMPPSPRPPHRPSLPRPEAERRHTGRITRSALSAPIRRGDFCFRLRLCPFAQTHG